MDALLRLFTGLFFFDVAALLREDLQFGSCDLVAIKGAWVSGIAMGTIDWPMGRIPKDAKGVNGDDGDWRVFPKAKGEEG